MKTIFYFLICSLFLVFSACYYNNEDDLYQNYKTSVCDTTTVTYVENMQGFFNGKCSSCHDDRNLTCKLNNFTNAQEYANREKLNLYNKVADGTHKGVYLTDCEKLKLKKWIETGAK